MRTRIVQHLDWLLKPEAAHSTGRRALFFAAKVAPEQLPAGFSGHDFAVFLLHVAAEIEHLLMVQYIYAAYSLGGGQVPEQRRDQVRGWQETILGIAKEEMGHFITVQNMLRLLGGPLNLERNDYPWDVEFYPFRFMLEKLTPASLARYVYTESPETWPDDVTPAERERIIDLATDGKTAPVRRVGTLYTTMIKIIGDRTLVPDALFEADTLPFQASWDEWGRGYRQGARDATPGSGKTPDLIIDTAYSRASAVAALQAVAEQGEAAGLDPDTDDKSHFRRFLEIFRKFPDDKAGWSATLPLATNPRVLGGEQAVDGTTYIANPQSRAWAQLLNVRYRMLLAYLSHAFNLSGADGHLQDAKARGMVVHRTFGEMYNIRAISRLLVHMPVDKPSQAPRAGPTFEMPYTVKLPTSERDCWRLHLDLLEAAAVLIREIAPGADAGSKDYLTTLSDIDRDTTVAIERLLGSTGHTAGRTHPQRSLV